MSKLLNQMESVELKQINAELDGEILNLHTEIDKLTREIERLKSENPGDKEPLLERISEYEQAEEEFQKQMARIGEEARSNNSSTEIVKLILSSLQMNDAAIVESAIERGYKRRETPRNIICFLSGVVVTLAVWAGFEYYQNDQFFIELIKQFSGLIPI